MLKAPFKITLLVIINILGTAFAATSQPWHQGFYAGAGLNYTALVSSSISGSSAIYTDKVSLTHRGWGGMFSLAIALTNTLALNLALVF